MLGHGRLHVVVDRARLHDAEQVVPVDLDHLVHPGQVEHDAAIDRVGAAGQAGAGAARHDGRAQFGADPDDVLDLGFRAGPHAGGGPPGRRPLGLVVGHGRQDAGIGDDPAAGQRPAQRLGQTAGAGLPRLAVARLAGTARSLR